MILPQSSAAVANTEPYTHVPPGVSLAAKCIKEDNHQMEENEMERKTETNGSLWHRLTQFLLM